MSDVGGNQPPAPDNCGAHPPVQEGGAPPAPVEASCAAGAPVVDSGSSDGLSSGDGGEHDDGSVEVFVGGLASTANESQVQEAFAAVGPVVSVRLSRRKKTGECKGFGFVRLPDKETAVRACDEVQEVGGKAVGVHLSRGRPSPRNSSDGELPLDSNPDASINRLLRLIRSHGDKRAAVSAALQAVMALPDTELASTGSEGAGGLAADKKAVEPIPDLTTYLNSYPKCQALINAFRLNSNTLNKTPLAILHEYATRLNLEVIYVETAESNLGPFNVEAKLSATDGSVLYASASGRGRGKKDAKQVAAAGVIETLLTVVPEADFLQPGKAKQRSVYQAYSRVGIGAPGRFGAAGVMGRGRRGPRGYGRADYAPYMLNPMPKPKKPGTGPVAPLDANFVPAASRAVGARDFELLGDAGFRREGGFHPGAYGLPGQASGSGALSAQSLGAAQMGGAQLDPATYGTLYTSDLAASSGAADQMGVAYDGSYSQQYAGDASLLQAYASAGGFNDGTSYANTNMLAALQQLAAAQQQVQAGQPPPPDHQSSGNPYGMQNYLQRPPY